MYVFNNWDLFFCNNFIYKSVTRALPVFFFGSRWRFRERFFNYFNISNRINFDFNNERIGNNWFLQIYLSTNINCYHFSLRRVFWMLHKFEICLQGVYEKKTSQIAYFMHTFFLFLTKNQLTFWVFSKFFFKPICNFYLNQYLPSLFMIFEVQMFKSKYVYVLCLFWLLKRLDLRVDVEMFSKIGYKKLKKIAWKNLKFAKFNFGVEFDLLELIFWNMRTLNNSLIISDFELVSLYNYYGLFFLFKKLETVKIKWIFKWIVVFDIKKRVLRVFWFLKSKGWGASTLLFFWKLFVNGYTSSLKCCSWIFLASKNYKFSFSVPRFALKFGIELPSMNFYKITIYDEDFNKASCREKTLWKWLYEYFKTDYCLTRWDYYVPLPLTLAQKKWVEDFWRYFETRDLKRWTNYFVLDNMMTLLRFTHFFWYFSCISPLLYNNLYVAFNNSMLLELSWQWLNYHWLQLIIDENRYYCYLWIYFNIKYYLPLNFFKFKVKLKKKIKKRC